jgi:hypothetical protein
MSESWDAASEVESAGSGTADVKLASMHDSEMELSQTVWAATDEIQFQLLKTDYPDFQHLVDKVIIIENKLKEMKKDCKRKMGPLRNMSCFFSLVSTSSVAYLNS